MYEKLQAISSLKEGDLVNDIFVLKSITKIQSYSSGTKYRFEMNVFDSSFEITVKVWGKENRLEVEVLLEGLKEVEVVHIKGRVQNFNGKLEINANLDGIVPVQKGEYANNSFVLKSEKDLNLMLINLKGFISKINDEEYRKVLNFIFDDENFLKQFSNCAASMFHHHNKVSGLLEHTLNILESCEKVLKLYPRLDSDLLITGALLHGIGKIEQLEMGVGINYSAAGKMLGDVYLAARKVNLAVEKFEIKDEKKLKLLNLILSQKGRAGHGSLKKAATAEALVLSRIKEMDASLAQLLKVKTEAMELGEDSFVFNKEFGNIFLE